MKGIDAEMTRLPFLALLLFAITPATAQTTTTTTIPAPKPLNGQTPEQTALDQAQCQNLASQATGYVPGATQQQASDDKKPSGSRARGAATGAIAGEVTGGSVSESAAIGAMAGGSSARRSRRKDAKEEKEAQAAAQQQAQAWQQNYTTCLQQRGYAL